MMPAMQITLNGQPTVLTDGANVRQLLEEHGLGSAACAVEVNREIVPKRKHEQRQLNEGDQVEIVTLVGGG